MLLLGSVCIKLIKNRYCVLLLMLVLGTEGMSMNTNVLDAIHPIIMNIHLCFIISNILLSTTLYRGLGMLTGVKALMLMLLSVLSST